MKKLFFIMAMSVCAFMAQAQTTSGIRVGLNMTSATGKYNDLMADQDYNNKSYMGYSVHYFIDVPVIGNFSIQPAIGLSMKGITYEYDKFTTKKSHRVDLDSYKKYDVTESRGTSVTQNIIWAIWTFLFYLLMLYLCQNRLGFSWEWALTSLMGCLVSLNMSRIHI